MHSSKFLWFPLLMIFTSFCIVQLNCQSTTPAKVDVGVILDLETSIGKIYKACISMALQDFYFNHYNYTTVIVPHFRDSGTDVIAAASAAIDLLKNSQVMAILGPQRSVEAEFVINIGDKVKVPIISPATSPALSPEDSPFFIRSAWSSSSQSKAIAALVKAYGWREVALICEGSNYGSGLLPFLAEDLLQSNGLVSYTSVVSSSARNDQILEQLIKLKTKQTRVFVVHMGPGLASRFFQMAKEGGMMRKGYAWIIADVLTSFLDSVDSDSIEAMQGVVGVRAYIPRLEEHKDFSKRFSRRFHKENPDMDRPQLNVFGVWLYDCIMALAEAIEHVGVTSPQFKKPINRGNLTDLEAIGTSSTGSSLAPLIRNFRFKGLSGDFHIVNGQLQPSAFEIVNVIGKGENRVGFWTEEHGISKKLMPDDDVSSMEKDNLGAIVWPGQTSVVPKGWEIPTSGNKLKVAVISREGFTEFVKVERDTETNGIKASGFCIDVFEQVMGSLPYTVPYELRIESYDYFTEQIPAGKWKYDAVVGDVTITANRSKFVDFTFPFTESGVSTIVPTKDDERKNAWIFMRPLTTGLWLTIGAFFVFTGFVVWVLEHRVNKAFRGPPVQQVGTVLWFSFSTLVFAHREKVKSNLTRFVMIVWVFVVLVLTQSYTASLTSMLTVEQLQPTITDIYDLIKNGEYVGYQSGSFVKGLFDNMKFDTTKFRNYTLLEEYDEALSKGSRNGGVAAIVDELPYIRLFLSKYCHKYTIIGPTYPTSGFGFIFPKGSPLVPDVSRAILELKESDEMVRISRKWFKEDGCPNSDGNKTTTESLNLDSFKGLFLIAGLSSSSALAIFVSTFLYENRNTLASTASTKKKLYLLSRVFYGEKDDITSSKVSTSPEERVTAQNPAISISCDQQDEASSTTQPATPSLTIDHSRTT